MNLIDRFCGVFFRRPVIRAERHIWASARTLDDLGRLTARWLTGDLKSQPGYYGPVDVDEDDAPGMTTALVACNRAGFVTHSSQAGFDGTGYDGAHWQQRAAVTGFAGQNVLDLLRDGLHGTLLGIVAHPVKTGHRRDLTGVPVTVREGRVFTTFGRQLAVACIADLYDGCSDAAIGALRVAWQVTVYDPDFGPNDLWAELAAVMTAKEAAA